MFLFDNMFDSLAVIAPMVPSLFSVLIPLLSITLFTFLVAIPRWFLMFSHWLWVRVVPVSLRERTIPGVQGRVFEGVAANRFEDKYTFSISDRDDYENRILDFFRKRGAKPESNKETLAFTRGNRFCTYFLPHIIPWRERDFCQKISVNTTRTVKGHIDIQVHYVVDTLCMLRLQPAGLQREVGTLYKELNRGRLGRT